ncbi:MAG: hypothetical protein QF570_13450 [Myxococcota bacterium]|jgi:hypothetical protein|nr:hypothetical protein [Myxococcota bacterium]
MLRSAWFAIVFCVAIAAPIAGSAAEETAKKARGMILITIDTLRADHVGGYGEQAERIGACRPGDPLSDTPAKWR